jgi:hypothetical protein
LFILGIIYLQIDLEEFIISGEIMRKILKYCLITFSSIILIFGLILILVVNFIDPNQYKPIIEKTISKVTNREFQIKGKLSWVIYPSLGIKIENVYLSSPNNFNNKDFIEFDSAEVSLGLISLLQKNIVLKRFNVDGLKLHFIQQNGVNNWTFVSKSNKISNNDEKEHKQDIKLTVNNLNFNNLTIIYDDYDINKHYQLKNVKILVDSDFNGGIKFNNYDQILDIKNINFNYNDYFFAHVNFKLKNFSHYKYSGQINIKKFALNKIALEYGFNQLNQPIFADVKASLEVIGNQNLVNINNLKLNLSDIIKLNSAISLTNNQNMNYNGKISVEPFNLNKSFNNLIINQNYSELFKKIFLYETFFTGDKNNINFAKFSLNISNYLKINFDNLAINNFFNPNIIAHMNIPKFNLHKIISVIGIKESVINNINWLNNILLDSNIRLNKNSLTLNDLKLKISDTNILGAINIKSFKPFNLSQNLFIDNLDLSNIINANGFKVMNKNIKLNGNIILLNNLTHLSGQEYIIIDDIKIIGISIDELINEFDKNVLKSFDKDFGKMVNSVPLIIRNIDLFKDKFGKIIKSKDKDYSKVSELGRLKLDINISSDMVNKAIFDLVGPIIISNGKGTINIIKETVDYEFYSKIVKKNINSELQKLIILSKLNGNFKDLNITLDWLSLQNQIVKILVNKGGEEIKKIINKNLDNNTKKIIDDVGKSINDAIGNLFGSKK